MSVFVTSYSLPCSKYASGRVQMSGGIFAHDFEDAVKIADQRGIGEVVDGRISRRLVDWVRPSDLIDCGEPMPKVLHAARYLCWIALKSGVATVDEILSDVGILHELAHMADDSGLIETETLNKLRAIEKRVPGFCCHE